MSHQDERHYRYHTTFAQPRGFFFGVFLGALAGFSGGLLTGIALEMLLFP